MQSLRALFALCLVSLTFVAAACSGEARRIDEYVAALGKLETRSPNTTVTTTAADQESESPGGAPLLCDLQTVAEIKLFDAFAAQGAAAKTLYPGALLNGDSLGDGAFNEIPLPKKPLTLSSNLSGAAAAATMEDPSLSAFLLARDAMLSPALEGGKTFAPKFTEAVELATVNEDQLSLTLGFNVEAGVATNVDVAGQFDFNDTTKRSRYLVRIVNELYTLAVDKPASASDYFADGVSLADVQAAFRDGNPPVYVDSVTYGRVIYLAVESSFSATELEAAIDASIKGVGFEVLADFGLTEEQVLSETSIKALAIGGLAEDQTDFGALADPETLKRIAQRDASVSEDFLGEPISFTVAYLLDNSRTVSDVAGAYSVESCRPKPAAPAPVEDLRVGVNQLFVKSVGDAGNDAELHGTIAVSYRGQRVFLFNKNEDQVVTFRTGNAPLSLFSSGTLTGIDTAATDALQVELNLVEVDAGEDDTFSGTVDIPVADILDGEETISFSGAGLAADLRIGFTAQ
jgi:hypothetical protein